VLLTTLGKLKALSATGASGFGALSNQEGNILKNSIANLDTAQSPRRHPEEPQDHSRHVAAGGRVDRRQCTAGGDKCARARRPR
jgi:hypothetical protein